MKKRTLTVGSLKPGQPPNHASKRDDTSPITANKAAVPSLATLHLTQNKKDYSVRSIPGKTLLTAALEQDQPIEYKCTKGTCGRCTVNIVNGSSLLSTPNSAEKEKLKDALKAGFRLACQAVFSHK